MAQRVRGARRALQQERSNCRRDKDCARHGERGEAMAPHPTGGRARGLDGIRSWLRGRGYLFAVAARLRWRIWCRRGGFGQRAGWLACRDGCGQVFGWLALHDGLHSRCSCGLSQWRCGGGGCRLGYGWCWGGCRLSRRQGGSGGCRFARGQRRAGRGRRGPGGCCRLDRGCRPRRLLGWWRRATGDVASPAPGRRRAVAAWDRLRQFALVSWGSVRQLVCCRGRGFGRRARFVGWLAWLGGCGQVVGWLAWLGGCGQVVGWRALGRGRYPYVIAGHGRGRRLRGPGVVIALLAQAADGGFRRRLCDVGRLPATRSAGGVAVVSSVAGAGAEAAVAVSAATGAGSAAATAVSAAAVVSIAAAAREGFLDGGVGRRAVPRRRRRAGARCRCLGPTPAVPLLSWSGLRPAARVRQLLRLARWLWPGRRLARLARWLWADLRLARLARWLWPGLRLAGSRPRPFQVLRVVRTGPRRPRPWASAARTPSRRPLGRGRRWGLPQAPQRCRPARRVPDRRPGRLPSQRREVPGRRAWPLRSARGRVPGWLWRLQSARGRVPGRVWRLQSARGRVPGRVWRLQSRSRRAPARGSPTPRWRDGRRQVPGARPQTPRLRQGLAPATRLPARPGLRPGPFRRLPRRL